MRKVPRVTPWDVIDWLTFFIIFLVTEPYWRATIRSKAGFLFSESSGLDDISSIFICAIQVDKSRRSRLIAQVDEMECRFGDCILNATDFSEQYIGL